MRIGGILRCSDLTTAVARATDSSTNIAKRPEPPRHPPTHHEHASLDAPGVPQLHRNEQPISATRAERVSGAHRIAMSHGAPPTI